MKKDNPGMTTSQIDLRLAAMEDSIKTANPSFVEARQKRIKLGIDLRGGEYACGSGGEYRKTA